MLQLKGIAASQGISFAKAYIFVEPNLTVKEVKVQDVVAEVKRFEDAIEISKKELTIIKDKAHENLGADKAAIFRSSFINFRRPRIYGNC